MMEGLMLVPPERGTIIGRALWKVGDVKTATLICQLIVSVCSLDTLS